MPLRQLLIFCQAYDLGEPPLSSEAAVVVFVVDENDHAPKFDSPLYRKTIPEDTPPGTSVTQVSQVSLPQTFKNDERNILLVPSTCAGRKVTDAPAFLVLFW